MFDHLVDLRRIAIAALLGLSVSLAACGGSGDGSIPPDQATGTVALLLTDMPTDDLDEINLEVVEATLIGGQGQQTLFSSAQEPIQIDLLKLENFSQPIAFEEVPADVYTKLRLRISSLTLVEYVEDGPDNIYTPPLPANGKIDLLDRGGFEVLPGRTLVVELDIPADMAIHVVQTGNSQSDKDPYRVRPVVFVEFSNTEAPDKLTRFEGVIDEIINAEAGSFVLCSSADADTCIEVSLTADGCVYDTEGVPTAPTALAEGQEVVVIGRYSRSGGDIVLDAIVVEQGPAEQVTGTVNSLPDENGSFLMIDRKGNEIVVELQKDLEQQGDCTQVFGPDGAIVGAAGLQVGQGIEVEGVRIVPPATSEDPVLLRAALILIDGDDAEEQLTGTIASPIEDSSFVLSTAGGDITVVLADGAKVLVVTGDSEQSEGDMDDVQVNRIADAYGELASDGSFLATRVVVETGG
jgi:hypothetical protein